MALLGAVIGLLAAMLRVSKVRLDFERLPDGEDKRILLRAIERSVEAMTRLAPLRRLVDFYVTAHNEVMPHSAFEGQTPDEMYFGTGGAVAINLTIARQAAREERMKVNRAAWCGVYIGGGRSEGVAVATATVQNVMRRSSATHFL